MKRPFMYIVSALILGIISYYFIEINIYLTLILLALSTIINILFIKWNKSMKISLLILFYFLGILLIYFKFNSSQLIEFVDMPVELQASIKEVKSSSEEEGRYIARVDNVKSNEVYKKTSEKIVLKIIGSQQVGLGDKISFNAILRQPLTNTNPKLFNYKLGLLSENIYTNTTIKDYDIVDIDRENLGPMARFKKSFVNRVENALDTYLTGDSSSLMKAVILGKSSYLDEGSIEQFRDLGLSHILAVSGLHIGILTGVLVGVMAYLGINRKINISLTIMIIWFYAYLIGNPPSVIRANIMFSILLFAETFGQSYDSINTLFFALFIMLIINPFWIFNIGFQLSFIASFSIIYLTPKINGWLYSYKGNLTRTLSSLLAIQIGLFPIQAYYFNRIPLISIFANLILVPLFTIALVLSMILILVSPLTFHISNSIGIIASFLLRIQFYGVDLFDNFPYLNLKLASPPIFAIILYFIFVFFLFNPILIKKLDKKLIKTMVVYLLLLLIINFTIFNLDRSLKIEFIDVGQGDCALLKTKDGNYLIDTGGSLFGDFDVGKSILIPYLEKSGIFKLEGVFISHYHADHCKALPYLMDEMKVENIYLGYKKEDNDLYRDIIDKAQERDVAVFIVNKGDRVRLDNNTEILAIGPDKTILEGPGDDENDLSLVLLMNYYNRRVLFTGDIEKDGEKSLVGDLDFPIDFLKVAHHGSRTSSTEEFLDKANPSIGFISVGRKNSFGHPNDDVIERYEDRGVELYRTDQDGLIELILNGNDYEIFPFIKEKTSLLYIIENYSLKICYFIIYLIISYIMVRDFAILEKEMEEIEL